MSGQVNDRIGRLKNMYMKQKKLSKEERDKKIDEALKDVGVEHMVKLSPRK